MNPIELTSIATVDSPPQHSPPDGSPPQQAVAEDDDSGGWGGRCCGCGCIGISGLLLLLVVGGAWTAWQAPRAVGADDWGETAEVFSSLEKLASGTSQGLGQDPGGVDAPDEQEAEQVHQGLDEFFDSLEETSLSEREISGIHAHMKEWEDTEEVEDFNETFERLEEMEDDDSFFTALRAMRVVYSLFFRAADLGESYNEHLDELDDEQRLEHQQFMAMIRVAQLSTPSDHEPWDDETAQVMLEDHDEHREDYEETRQVLEEAYGDPDFDPDDLDDREQRQLTEAFGNQFLYAASAINRESLETWQELSEEERKDYIEDIDAPHHLVGRYIGGILLAGEKEEPHHLYLRMAGM